jgi:two-component system OmpR family response regulator
MSRIDDAPRARRHQNWYAGSVAILAWPEEAERAAALARAGQPRLLLVGADDEPPGDWDDLTDWVRLPVDDRDLCVRVAALQRLGARPPEPTLDEFDVLWRGDRWVALAPIEARLLDALLAECGAVVSRCDLGSAAWPGGVPGARAVDARLRRLRSRIAPLGLAIHNVHRRGLMLEVGSPPAAELSG